MSARIRSVRRFLVVGLLFAPVFLWLSAAVLGDEEEQQACNAASAPSQYTPTAYPVDSTELVITEGQLSFTGTNSSTASHRNATISMDTVPDDYGTGRILVAWEGNTIGSNCTGSAIYAIHLNSDGSSACAPVFLSPPVGTYTGFHTNAYQPSAALTGDGDALVAWTGHAYGAPPATFPEARAIAFALDDLCSLSPPSAPLQPNGGYRDQEISVGIGSVSSVASWSRASDTPGDALPGLLYTVTDEEQIRACNPCWEDQWRPCAAMRSDSKYIICWSDFEYDDGLGHTFFDIRLQAYDADGSTIGSEVTVNIPISVVDYTTEDSPAVAIDAPDGSGISNVIVVWTSRQPDGCANRRHIYARRLTWDGVSTPAFVSEQFMVDNDTSFKPISATLAHPTVALTTDPDHRGRWVAAWNAYSNSGDPPTDIHAQFFEADGKPMGREFRVNQAHESSGTQYSRFLANSAQHTTGYGSTAAFAWTRGNLAGGAFTFLDVYFTLLPAGYAEYQESLAPGCLRGDVNFDGLVNTADIPIFVAVLLDGPPGGACSNIIDLCPYDLNVDGAVNGLDVQCFTLTILGLPCSPTTLRFIDCNANSVPDGEDIENETSNDANSNSVPDECEIDCNTNGVPDDWDIA